MKFFSLSFKVLGILFFFQSAASIEDSVRRSLKQYNDHFLQAFEQGYNYKAREYAGKALIIALKNGLSRDIAMANSNLAIINTKMGDYEKANLNNFIALRIFKEMNDTLHIARCNLSIGTVYIRLKEYKKALKYIEEARDSFYKLHNQLGYSICLSNTGSIYLELKDYKKAMPIFFEAVEIDEKNHDPSGTSSNFTDIGVIYLKIGNYSSAELYLKKALAIDKAMGDISGLASIYLNLSELMLKNGKTDSAQYYCKQSLRIYQKTGQLAEIANVYRQFSEINEHLGEYKSAFNYYVKATILSDSLLNVEKAARIAMLEEKYINERLSNEIISLEYRNNLQESKIKNQRILGITWLTGLILAIVAILIIVIQLKNKNAAYKYIVSKNIDLMRKEKELYEVKYEMGVLKQQMDIVTETHIEERHRSGLPANEKIKLLDKLKDVLLKDKIFTKTDLTIDKLARKLSTNRTYLSQLINEEYHKTYSDFINEYRLKQAMILLSDPVLSNRYSIDAIAKESGFNNISTFNSLFRKFVGLTPSLFRKNAHNQSEIASEKDYELTKS
jgi:AraC-like DNA-binding protein/tetratricopeptide (TPR) repeat protein